MTDLFSYGLFPGQNVSQFLDPVNKTSINAYPLSRDSEAHWLG